MAIPWHYVLAWFPLVVIALAIGLLRDAIYSKRREAARARRFSFALAAVAFGLYALAVVLLVPPGSQVEAWWIGGIWAVMTLAFELPIRWLAPRPAPNLDELEAGERPQAARFGWPLLVWIGVAPWAWYRILELA